MPEAQVVLPFKQGQKILEVGGGDIPVFRPNLDFRKLPTVDYVGDLEEVWPIEDTSFDGIFGKFCIEHVSWRKTQHFANECFRILSPGGIAIMISPNTLEQCKEVARTGRIDIEESAMLFGGQEEHGWNEHKAAFSPEYATKLFKNAGFENVEIETWPGQIWTGARTDMIIKAFKRENKTESGFTNQKWYQDLNNNLNSQVEKVKLNIGSFTVMSKDNWVNADILDLSSYAGQNGYKFKQFDATKGIPYKNNEVDLIITSHFMEHITRQEGTQFLKECFRVMKPNGIIRIAVPNMKLITQYYLEDASFKNTFKENEGVKNSEDITEAYWNFITAGHKTAYDEDSLGKKMKEVGFIEVNKSLFGQSRSPEIKSETKDMFEDHSLYMEAVKPNIEIHSSASDNRVELYQQYLLGLINEGKQ